MNKKEQVLDVLKCFFTMSIQKRDEVLSAIDAIYNPPPPPTRDHNSLAVTENTPSGTIIVMRFTRDSPCLRVLSHVEEGRAYFYLNGNLSGETNSMPVENFERYIGQHFIPWDAKQSDGMLPCGGVVAITTRNGVMRTDQADSLMWSRITGYLPITDTGEIDWTRVPR